LIDRYISVITKDKFIKNNREVLLVGFFGQLRGDILVEVPYYMQMKQMII
jgi:hypothetical protein